MAVAALTINGVEVPQPAEITYIRSDLDSENSFRTVTGKMQRDRICTKVKLECKWNGLTASQMSTLLQSMSAEFFTVGYFDPYTGGMNSKRMYVGDRSAPSYSFINGKAVFKSFSANFIEQ